MTRDELDELHYITPIANVPEILRRGILSNRKSKSIRHQSVAMQEVQDLRAKVVVPGGRPLHEYANLYITARNPMLFVRRDQHRQLCVLRVSTDVLDVPGVVVTDANASSPYRRWGEGPAGLEVVDRELTFAEYWTASNQLEYWRRKSAKCAEVLVPDQVLPRFLVGAYVSCEESLARFNALGTGLPVTVNSGLFFL